MAKKSDSATKQTKEGKAISSAKPVSKKSLKLTDEKAILEQVIEQENRLVFPRFNHQIAYDLGFLLYTMAVEGKFPITIDIRKGSHVLYHVALEGTTPNNERWVVRKSNTVQLVHKSSYRIGLENRLGGTSLERRQFVSSLEYADHGGSFPIRVKDLGVIGAITVSGLAQEEDHQLVIEALEQVIGSRID